jgi:AcrR family transcriptional regulator
MVSVLSHNIPKQTRSRKTTEALLRVGLRKLEQNGVDSLSMAEVAAEAGSSVGSLYFRFGDKNQFVSAILSLALNDTRDKIGEMLGAARSERWSPEETLGHWVATMVDIIGQHRALLRAVLRHSLSQPEAWDPIRQFGRDTVEQLMRVLGEAEPPMAVPDWQRRVRVGLQVVHGTLLNMIISSPGPLTFEHAKATARELSTVMVRYVWAEPV